MLKKALFFLLCFSSLHAMAQEGKTNSAYSKPSRDYFMFQLGYDNWLKTPDSVKIGGGLNRSANVYLCYDFPIKNSNFSFAAGVGVGTSHIFFENQKLVIDDTLTQIQFVGDNDRYKRFKYSLAYVESPFELRYFTNKENRNKGFKAAIGLKVGALVNAHTKGKVIYNNKPINEKVSTRRYLETWRVASTLRLGYGNFSVYGAYHLNSLFRVGNGPEGVTPYSVGICISGL
jgi:hypothetical protein